MLYVYIGCLTFGVLYAIISGLMGVHGFDHGGVDGHGNGGDSGDVPSPFNPLVMASAITAFGSVGIITKLGFKMGDLVSSAFSLGLAGVIGAIIFFGIVKFMYSSQSNTRFSLDDLVGTEARVLTPVPKNGMGEITYVMNGMRYNITAKTDQNKEIGRGEAVKIKEVVGNIAIVVPKITFDDFNFLDQEEKRSREKEENI